MSTPRVRRTMNLTIEVTIHALRNGVTYAIVWCFRTSAEPTNGQVIDVAQQMYITILPLLRVLFNQSVVFSDAVARCMDPRSTFEYTQAFTSGNVGTRGGNPASGNVAKAVKWLTTLGGRSGQGHTYFGGLLQADVTNDFIGNSLMFILTAFLNYMQSYITPSGAQFAVGTRKLGGSTPITGYVLTNLVNDIGRRLIGRGRHD